MNTVKVKIPAGPQIRQHAAELLTALAEAAKQGNGVMARDLPVTGGMERQAAARMLRQRGIPIYARRAARNSAWFLLHHSDPAEFRKVWRDRIIADCYTEVCRAHMAMVRQSFAADECRELSNFAIVLGNWLGLSTQIILDDLTPQRIPGSMERVLNEVETVLGSP